MFYVTDGIYNYYESKSYAECLAKAEDLTAHDRELKAFYMDKYGYIPEGVDIHPEGYLVSSNRHN